MSSDYSLCECCCLTGGEDLLVDCDLSVRLLAFVDSIDNCILVAAELNYRFRCLFVIALLTGSVAFFIRLKIWR